MVAAGAQKTIQRSKISEQVAIFAVKQSNAARLMKTLFEKMSYICWCENINSISITLS